MLKMRAFLSQNAKHGNDCIPHSQVLNGDALDPSVIHGKASNLLVRLVVEHCLQHYELFDIKSLQVLAVSVVLPLHLF